MPRRRAPARGGCLAPSSQRGTPGRVRRNTRNRQAPHRYGQVVEPKSIESEREESQELESLRDEGLPSEYSQTQRENTQPNSHDGHNSNNTYSQRPTNRPASPRQISQR